MVFFTIGKNFSPFIFSSRLCFIGTLLDQLIFLSSSPSLVPNCNCHDFYNQKDTLGIRKVYLNYEMDF